MTVDLVGLRQLVEKVVQGLGSHTHRELDELCPQLGLPPLPAEGSKSKRLDACLADLQEESLAGVTQRLLGSDRVFLGRADRVALEDALWAAGPVVEIPGRVRRDLARSVDILMLVYRADRFMRLLEQWWVLEEPFEAFMGPLPNGLRALIDQHVFRNPGDWSTEELFEQLGAFEAGHARFGRFLEGLVAPATVPDVPTQNRIVEAINALLGQAGARLVQTDLRDGYPYFQLVHTGSGLGRSPKNLIFASSAKPDIRFRSAVDNDIEVLQGLDEVLYYDRPIGPEGVRWCDLQQWWQDATGTTDAEAAKTALYNRLLACLPDEKDSPQVHLFRLYHQIHGPHVRSLPALLPEVWLHWDHKTVKKRGVEALLRHRMDFLMLLPGGRRLVLEVDGRHHYADGKAYADTVSGDRDLKLRGYEVFRFGSTELSDPGRARPLLQGFFADLFDRYDMGIPPAPQT
ncbi:hypothetical protein [Kitasatospora sp. NPDC090091]|uniref:AbiJ-related protein n=1 Tax=Kitasatospora sp. NPDC090091 TaxID=3364081 RepID=UPI00382E3BAE